MSPPQQAVPLASGGWAAPPSCSRSPKTGGAPSDNGPSLGITMNASSRRFLSVWLRRLSTDRIERRLPASDETPPFIRRRVKAALRICAFNDAAAALGLKLGMPLADALAMYPSIAVHEADHQADSALLEEGAHWRH